MLFSGSGMVKELMKGKRVVAIVVSWALIMPSGGGIDCYGGAGAG